jgi:hypothetical protein
MAVQFQKAEEVTTMKYISHTLLLLAAALLAIACQESLEGRCQRESKSYTKKHCPLRIDEFTVMDSMTFHAPSHTVCYAYTLYGNADDADAVSKSDAHQLLRNQVRNSAHLKLYKEAGYSFRYIYFSAKDKGRKLLDTTISEKDYR